jgi:hypothetical protein
MAQYRKTDFVRRHVPATYNYLLHNQGVSAQVNRDGVLLFGENHILELKDFGHDGKELQIYDAETRELTNRHVLPYGWYRNVAYTNDRIYLIETHNRRMSILDSQGKHLKYVDIPSASVGIAVLDGRVFVSDLDSHAIYAFDGDGNALFSFGEYGEGAGRLNSPHNIFAFNGRLAVLSTRNNRIEIFDRDGHFIETWGAGLLDFPEDGMVLLGRLFVLDENKYRVRVFDGHGKLETTLYSAHEKLEDPKEIMQGVYVRYIDHRPALPYIQVIRPAAEVLTKDKASTPDLGGIDFNPAKIDLKTKQGGGAIQFNVDPAMLQRMQNASGVTPVIVGVHSLDSLSAFM